MDFCGRSFNQCYLLFFLRFHGGTSKGIEQLRRQRDVVVDQLLVDEEEKVKIQNDLHILTERLARVNESISAKVAARDRYDATIEETEVGHIHIAYMYVRRRRLVPRIHCCYIWSAAPLTRDNTCYLECVYEDITKFTDTFGSFAKRNSFSKQDQYRRAVGIF